MSESGPPEPWRRRAFFFLIFAHSVFFLLQLIALPPYRCGASAGGPAFKLMTPDDREEGRGESGPPEPWRRRAFFYVYVLRAIQEPELVADVGWTRDLRQRLKEHNWRMSAHSARHPPWEVVWYGPREDSPTLPLKRLVEGLRRLSCPGSAHEVRPPATRRCVPSRESSPPSRVARSLIHSPELPSTRMTFAFVTTLMRSSRHISSSPCEISSSSW